MIKNATLGAPNAEVEQPHPDHFWVLIEFDDKQSAICQWETAIGELKLLQETGKAV